MNDFNGRGSTTPDRIGERIELMSLTGRPQHFWPADPNPDEIDPVAIGMALARVNRFCGQTLAGPYTVAQHSVMVAEIAMAFSGAQWGEKRKLVGLGKWGLLHDAAEVLGLGDISRPVKQMIRAESETVDFIESCILSTVATHFSLPWPMPAEVERADSIALCTEARDLFGSHTLTEWHWEPDIHPLAERIEVWPWQQAEHRWLELYRELGR